MCLEVYTPWALHAWGIPTKPPHIIISTTYIQTQVQLQNHQQEIQMVAMGSWIGGKENWLTSG